VFIDYPNNPLVCCYTNCIAPPEAFSKKEKNLMMAIAGRNM